MNYIELSCNYQFPNPQVTDILIAELTELDFESFMETEKGLMAYIPAEKFSEKIAAALPMEIGSNKITYEQTSIEPKNWNEEWEKDYAPVIINDQCIIKAPFHKNLPDYPYTILIEPKMSFGTGHHETTSLMINMMLTFDFTNKKVLDIGCGTGVLAILASKMGAKEIFAADIDTWAYENSVENIDKNKCKNIVTKLGGMEVIPNRKFDVILANINRNILLENIGNYAGALDKKGHIFFSGIYKNDVQVLQNSAERYGLTFKKMKEKNDWVALEFAI